MSIAVRFALMLLALLAGAGPAAAVMPAMNPAVSLRAGFERLSGQLSHNQFQRAIYLESGESQNELKGDIYALVEYPFETVGAAFSRPRHWCDALMLHMNTKYCRASADEGTSATTPHGTLVLGVGKKLDEPFADAYGFEFAFRVAAKSPDYLQVELDADKGPLGTSNYRIMLEAVPVAGGRTFLHFSYSYACGVIGRVAVQAYLATSGRDKVGFTVLGTQLDGQPDYVRGVRGMMERNTMRYYLALDANLKALPAPPREQFESRLQYWFSATERYPRQLHEMERSAYLDMKRSEHLRQQEAP
jgi:hypothetical protein